MPEDFDGDEQGEPDDINYQRILTEPETALMGVGPDRYEDWEIEERAAQRDAWFAALAGGGGVTVRTRVRSSPRA